MTTFLLIRHATNDTVGKRIAGRTRGIHLNDEGKRQSIELAERLQHLRLNEIYSSPLERAIETAEPLSQQTKLDIHIHDGLLEIDFGEWSNKTIEELKTIQLFHQFNTERSSTRIPGGELMSEAQARIVSCIEELYTKHKNDVIALFSHADMIRAAIAHYTGIHINNLQNIEISPASVSIIRKYDDAAQLILMNHTGTIAL